jgi:hypothetical protein
MFRAEGVTNLRDTNPKTRFSAPSPNAVFEWHLRAETPSYQFCVARVQDVSEHEIKAWFLNPKTGAEFTETELPGGQPFEIDLDDLDQVWRHSPSVVDYHDGGAEYATLFVTEKWLKNNAQPLHDIIHKNPSLRSKFPPGEDGLPPEQELLFELVKTMVKQLKQHNIDPTQANFFGDIEKVRQAFPGLL